VTLVNMPIYDNAYDDAIVLNQG